MKDPVIDARIRSLPPFPLVARKLIAVMQNENCSAAEISKVLSGDQALASQVLKLSNSSFYGHSGKVGSIPRAVVILGFAAVRSMALAVGFASTIKQVNNGLDLSRIWQHAIHVAAA